MWTDNASQIDMLFYKPYAEIVSNVAVETDRDPLTIGVFGMGCWKINIAQFN